MRDLIISAIRAELERQANLNQTGTPYLYNESGEETGIDGTVDLGGIAEAVIKELPQAIPAHHLVERLTAIADRMEGAFVPEVEDASQLVFTYRRNRELTQDQAARVQAEIKAWQVNGRKGPLLMEGFDVAATIRPPVEYAINQPIFSLDTAAERHALRLRDPDMLLALRLCDRYFTACAAAWTEYPEGIPEEVGQELERLCDAAGDAVQKALAAPSTQAERIAAGIQTLPPECSCGAKGGEEHKQTCNIFAWDPEEPIEVTPAERSAMRKIRDSFVGSETHALVCSEASVELPELARRGLIERGELGPPPALSPGRWTVTPLGLRAIEQEAL